MAFTHRCSFLSLLFLLFLIAQKAPFARGQDDEESNEESEADKDTVTVETHSGPVMGKVLEDEDGDKLYAFMGIPYAEAPVDELRFQEPVLKKPWKDALNATAFGSICPQKVISGEYKGEIFGEEDCLFINVMTPRLPAQNRVRAAPESSLLPVMIYVHGGGFNLGSGDLNPEPLVKKDVIVVTLNYRLGVLGFLNLGTPFIAGNQGLKDQLLAFAWVHMHIRDFGGNPNQVVIFGESAGAMSVHLHQLSPKGQGLYHGVIAQSGTALSPYIKYDSVVPDSIRMAKEVGCEDLSPQAVVDCLQEKKIDQLNIGKAFGNNDDLAVDLENTLNGNGSYFMGPSIDSVSHNALLPQHPLKIMKSGAQKDMPFISGNTLHDGGALTATMWNSLEALSANWTYLGAGQMFAKHYDQLSPLDMLKANVTRHFYLGDQEITPDVKKELGDFFSDAVFLSPHTKTLNIMSRTQRSPVFAYELSHQPSKSIVLELFLSDSDAAGEDFGTIHADDLSYLFKDIGGIEGTIATEEDEQTRNVMTTLWTNFAKHLDPAPYTDNDTPEWNQYQKGSQFYLDIKPEPEVKEGFHTERMYFWDKTIWEDKEAALLATTLPAPITSLPTSPVQPAKLPVSPYRFVPQSPVGQSSQARPGVQQQHNQQQQQHHPRPQHYPYSYYSYSY